MEDPAAVLEEEPLSGNYFVSTYPPFSTWNSEGAGAFERALQSEPWKDNPLGLYLHVPFCIERCRYCYYLSNDDRLDRMGSYVGALEQELSLLRELPAVAGRELSFLYIGGGTPTSLAVPRLSRLLGTLREFLPRKEDVEFTVECAPKTINRDKLAALRDGGVTRLSMGVQQLDDEVLQRNGRVHLVKDVERAWESIRGFDFDVVNLDLMVGLVGETEETFHRSLERVIEWSPQSVTLYLLEIPRNTPLYTDLRDGNLGARLPDWGEKRQRLRDAFSRLESAGYHVRSAYALVRDPERHRFRYQEAQYHGADLLGVGASAFSYLSGVHHQNLCALDAYTASVASGSLPLWRGHELGSEERMRREFLLRLKLGVVFRGEFQDRFGVDPAEYFRETLDDLTACGCMSVEPEAIRLSRGGLLRVDRILPRFYMPKHRGVRYS